MSEYIAGSAGRCPFGHLSFFLSYDPELRPVGNQRVLLEVFSGSYLKQVNPVPLSPYLAPLARVDPVVEARSLVPAHPTLHVEAAA